MSGDLLTIFRYYLANNSNTVTKEDCTYWLEHIAHIKSQLEYIKFEFSVRDLAFIQFFLPSVKWIKLKTHRYYNDEGGTDQSYEGLQVSNGDPFLEKLLHDWGQQFFHEHNSIYIDLNRVNVEHVAKLQHPLLSLFKGYTPSNTETWDTLWTLFRSTNYSDFQQACVLMDGLIEGDEVLRNSLLRNVFSNQIHSVKFDCGNWWMILFLEEGIYEPENSTINDEGIQWLLQSAGYEENMCIAEVGAPAIVTNTVGSKIFNWIYQSLMLSPYYYYGTSKQEDLEEFLRIFEWEMWLKVPDTQTASVNLGDGLDSA